MLKCFQEGKCNFVCRFQPIPSSISPYSPPPQGRLQSRGGSQSWGSQQEGKFACTLESTFELPPTVSRQLWPVGKRQGRFAFQKQARGREQCSTWVPGDCSSHQHHCGGRLKCQRLVFSHMNGISVAVVTLLHGTEWVEYFENRKHLLLQQQLIRVVSHSAPLHSHCNFGNFNCGVQIHMLIRDYNFPVALPLIAPNTRCEQ